MPQVSRIKLDDKIERDLLGTLNIVLMKISKSEDIDQFLLALMTPTERLMLAKRLGIIILLREGLPDSRIAQTLHVTRITVSRMQLFLEARGEGYEVAMKILQNEKLAAELKANLKKLASYAVRAAGGRI